MREEMRTKGGCTGLAWAGLVWFGLVSLTLVHCKQWSNGALVPDGD